MDDTNKHEENNTIIDVPYKEEMPTVYLSVPEVAKTLNETESTIRYWCDSLEKEKIMKIKREGRERRLSKKNLQILIDMQTKRRKENYTIKQTYNYLKQKYMGQRLQILQGIPKNNDMDTNEIFVKAISNILSSEINKSLQDMTDEIIQNINDNIQNQNKIDNRNKEELKDFIKNFLEKNKNEIKNMLDNKELEATKRDNEMMDKLKESMEERREEYKKSKGHSIFSKIFHRG